MLKESCTIFIVDDVEENAKLLDLVLRRNNYNTLIAYDGEEAVREIPKAKPDLILLDINMPQMDGYEVCKVLKNKPEIADIPIIFITALTETDNIVEAFERGGIDYITKPFNRKELLSRVNTHVELKFARDYIKKQNKNLEEANNELQKSQVQFVKSEKKYKRLFEQSNDGIIIRTIDGDILDINEKICQMIDFSHSELLRTKIAHLETLVTIQTQEKRLKKLIDRKAIRYETSLQCANGKVISVDVSSKLIEPERGIIQEIYRDITQKKRIADEIRKQEKYFRKIYDLTPFAIFTVSKTGFIKMVNNASLKVFKLPFFSEILNREMKDISFFLESEIINDFNQVVISKTNLQREYIFKLDANITIYANCQFILLKDLERNISDVYLLFEDITARKLAEIEIRKLSTAVEQNPNSVIITDTDGIIEYINPEFSVLTGCSSKDAIGRKLQVMESGIIQNEVNIDPWDTIKENKVWEGEYLNKKKNGEEFWEKSLIAPITDENKNIINYIAIAEDVTLRKKREEQILFQQKELQKINESLLSSISYARVIQNAVMPSELFLKQFLPESFVLFLPRDIVSGDFYWIKQVQHKIFIAAADCTGHGVPGAFMSMLGIALLNEIVSSEINPDNLKANEILNELRKKIKHALHQDRRKSSTSDGMDIALCIIDLTKNEMQYAGANNPLYLIRKNNNKPEVIKFKADRMPIGVYLKERSFTNNIIDLNADDLIYIFSDGFVDQFGGDHDRKYQHSRFREFLLSKSHLILAEQKEALNKEFNEWKGDKAQIDDVLIVGLKIYQSYGEVDLF